MGNAKTQGEVIAVIGLGYVGLPIALAFSKHFTTIGFDTSALRAAELQSGNDRTGGATRTDLRESERLTITSNEADLRKANVFIVAVPTPVDDHRRPDLESLRAASHIVGRAMARGATVVFESTVYPGATEEFCVPILESESHLTLNQGFVVGYSPERINPGDDQHGVMTVVKVTSGSNADAAEFIDALYSRVIEAGTYRAPSIRVAEAAKVIENTQRDVNIALINELALVFDRLGIDTHDVLAAAATKWNFLRFTPGLVGGHCIGVDPYYLTHKSEEVGYRPEVILAGRRINDKMGEHVADKLILLLAQADRLIPKAKVIIFGLAFKANVPDLRNTRVIDIINRLSAYNVTTDVVDPLVSAEEAKRYYELTLKELNSVAGPYDAVILAVNHDLFGDLETRIPAILNEGGVVFDVTGSLPRELVTARL